MYVWRGWGGGGGVGGVGSEGWGGRGGGWVGRQSHCVALADVELTM